MLPENKHRLTSPRYIKAVQTSYINTQVFTDHSACSLVIALALNDHSWVRSLELPQIYSRIKDLLFKSMDPLSKNANEVWKDNTAKTQEVIPSISLFQNLGLSSYDVILHPEEEVIQCLALHIPTGLITHLPVNPLFSR